VPLTAGSQFDRISGMPECFIIMPVSTPESWLSRYSDDPEHFTHVLEYLFKPAVEKAGYTPVSPIAKGADLIHAEIIKNIEKAELVLCDMSTLNPNVFYEVGIRTAVNKPVCMVKDDKTENVPFDTTILNYQPYCSALRPWNQVKETERLAAHIQESAKRSGDQNTLWKYFGLSTRAALPEGKSSTDDRLQLLTLQIEGLGRQLNEMGERSLDRKEALAGYYSADELDWMRANGMIASRSRYDAALSAMESARNEIKKRIIEGPPPRKG
jgi:hypothetical protein